MMILYKLLYLFILAHSYDYLKDLIEKKLVYSFEKVFRDEEVVTGGTD